MTDFIGWTPKVVRAEPLSGDLMPKTRRLKWLTTRDRQGNPSAYLIETSRYTPDDLRRLRAERGVGPVRYASPKVGYKMYPALARSEAIC